LALLTPEVDVPAPGARSVVLLVVLLPVVPLVVVPVPAVPLFVVLVVPSSTGRLTTCWFEPVVDRLPFMPSLHPATAINVAAIAKNQCKHFILNLLIRIGFIYRQRLIGHGK
jgi:hypothetical protein